MTSLTPVVWSEGMHLSQHHFQLQRRYLEGAVHETLSELFFGSWGVASLELSGETLASGTLSILHARGIMPDGLPFRFPEEAPPEALDLKSGFSPTDDARLVLLGVPGYDATRPVVGDGAASPARFVAEEIQVFDEITGRDQKPVAVGRKNFRLLLEGEPDPRLVTLPLARVRRDGKGGFVLDPEFIPPCLRVGASRRIMEILGRSVEMLEAKAQSLASERRTGASSGSPQELVRYWLSHAIHSALPSLRHHLDTRAAHPEQVFAELSRLGGALCTFALDSHPSSLPLYRHDDLETSFRALDRHIRAHLDVVLPSTGPKIDLEPLDRRIVEAVLAREGAAGRALDETLFYSGTVKDERALGGGYWFLGIRSEVGRAQLISRVPDLVKVCSGEEDIVKLVQRGLAGLSLEHEPSPPPEIAPRVGMEYFRADLRGSCWDLIRSRRTVGVYVPAAFPGPELELRVVLAR